MLFRSYKTGGGLNLVPGLKFGNCCFKSLNIFIFTVFKSLSANSIISGISGSVSID